MHTVSLRQPPANPGIGPALEPVSPRTALEAALLLSASGGGPGSAAALSLACAAASPPAAREAYLEASIGSALGPSAGAIVGPPIAGVCSFCLGPLAALPLRARAPLVAIVLLFVVSAGALALGRPLFYLYSDSLGSGGIKGAR